jgi:ElaB/YqjD/DUF883 family membrane-anchored ribosome-binding protein
MNSAASASASRDRRAFSKHARQLRQETGALAASAEAAVGDLQGALRHELDCRPYATLAAAAGVGFVLGGGLASRLTQTMLGVANRVVMAVVAREIGDRLGLWPTDGSAPGDGRRLS